MEKQLKCKLHKEGTLSCYLCYHNKCSLNKSAECVILERKGKKGVRGIIEFQKQQRDPAMIFKMSIWFDNQ